MIAAWLPGISIAADAAAGQEGLTKFANEFCATAVLRNGFTIRYTQREAQTSTTRLWLCEGSDSSLVSIPSDQIERFEQAEDANRPALTTAARATKKAVEASAPGGNPIKAVIVEAARRHQIDPDFLTSIVDAESRFNPVAVSPKGAGGLMQLMPQTAALFGVRNSFDPAQNLEGGTRYLRQLLDRYHWDPVKVLAAYNAGPHRVEQYGGIPPFRETRAYIARIIEDFNRKKAGQNELKTPMRTPETTEPASARQQTATVP